MIDDIIKAMHHSKSIQDKNMLKFDCEREEIVENIGMLKSRFNYNMLVDITAIDNLARIDALEAEHTLAKKRAKERILIASRRLSADPSPNAELEIAMKKEEARLEELERTTISRFEMVYILRSFHEDRIYAGLVVIFRVKLPSDDLQIASIEGLYKSASWMEREVYDMYGINFKGHKNMRRILTHHEFKGHPLRKDYEITKRQPLFNPSSLEEEMEEALHNEHLSDIENAELRTHLMYINVGPAHPATHGTIRNLLALDGELIVSCVSEIGYLHRGFEKSCENHTYNQIVPYTDRLNYCSPILNNIGYCKAIEDALGVTIPDRAIFARVILGELYRIVDHLVCLAAICVDSGALTNYWYLFNPREEVYTMLSKLCGARFTNSYTRIGGVAYEFYDGFFEDVENVLNHTLRNTGQVLALIERNKIFMDRTQNLCKISREDALAFSLTGPNLRASGVEYDIRKDAPYYYYDTFDFAVPVGSVGDIYDRIMVRFYEMKESAKIIRQAIKAMPTDGPLMLSDASIALPPKSEVYNSIEGLINQFKLVFEGVKVPKQTIYSATEAGNGELGFYIVADGSGTPYKVKVKPPCFNALSSYASTVKGHMLADCILHLGSLNIIAGELDR